MECVLIFLALVFLSVLCLILAILFPGGFSNYEPVLRYVSAKMGGHLSKHGWFLPSSVAFLHGTSPALFRIQSTGGIWLELKLIMREIAPLVLEIRADNVHDKHATFPRKMQFKTVALLTVDNREYELRTDAPSHVAWFQNEGVLQQFAGLQAAGFEAPLYISFLNSQLTIRKPWSAHLIQNHQVLEFLYEALRLHDYLRLARAEGITFVDSAADIGQLEQLNCGVCGEGLGEEFVECRRCKAPHHLECWNYNGSCGTFACKETRYNVSPHSHPISWFKRMFPGN
jgi:Prokaryotic RING finger family 1